MKLTRSRTKDLAFFTAGDLWVEVGELVRAAVVPMFVAAFSAGAQAAAAERRVKTQLRRIDRSRRATKALTVDFELIAQRAELLIAEYYDSWWRSLSRRLQDSLRQAIEDALAEGGGGITVARQIAEDFRAEQFTPERINTIAVTETTRLMGMGAQETYRAAGFAGWRRQTAQDGSVCPECEADAQLLHPMSEAFEPLHPNDRCWPVPEGDSTLPIDDTYLVEV